MPCCSPRAEATTALHERIRPALMTSRCRRWCGGWVGVATCIAWRPRSPSRFSLRAGLQSNQRGPGLAARQDEGDWTPSPETVGRLRVGEHHVARRGFGCPVDGTFRWLDGRVGSSRANVLAALSPISRRPCREWRRTGGATVPPRCSGASWPGRQKKAYLKDHRLASATLW